MSKVISTRNRDHYSIKPYVFSSSDTQTLDMDDDYGDIEPLSKSLGYVFNDSGEEDLVASTHEHHDHEDNQQQATVDMGQEVQASKEIIDSLYKKIEELSDKLVRLEMELEDKDAKLQEQVLQTKTTSHEEGYNACKTELTAMFSSELDEKQRMVTNAMAKLDNVANEYIKKLSDIESDLVSTALAIAGEVVKVELSKRSSEVALAISEELIAKLKEASSILVKTNPIDVGTLQTALSENSRVKVEADDAISKGGVIVLSSIGNLDGNIYSRLEKIIKEASE